MSKVWICSKCGETFEGFKQCCGVTPHSISKMWMPFIDFDKIKEESQSEFKGLSHYMVTRGDDKKKDHGKTMWDLLPWNQVEKIVDTLTFGASKYGPNQWQTVENGKDRYFAAMMQHITAWWGGEKLDPESGKHHLAHAGCCLLFLMWLDDQPKDLTKEELKSELKQNIENECIASRCSLCNRTTLHTIKIDEHENTESFTCNICGTVK